MDSEQKYEDARERKARLSRAEPARAWELFRRAPAVRFASFTADQRPILRTLNAVELDGRLCFHAGDHGEKLGLLGRPALASYDEVVADIPSYWIHPELACPASTYYLSAIAEGTVERVHDLAHKARILNALMQRFQPEGGYAPLSAEDKRYTKVLEQLLVAELQPIRISAKHKLGQHRTVAQIERVLEGLWARGKQGDLRAIRLIRDAHPASPSPAFLRGPSGSELCVAPDERDAREVAALLAGQYWTELFTAECMAQAQLGSTAWVLAREPSTRAVIGSARAVTDRARFGYVLDVIVRPDQRGRGFGAALTRLLLAHPALRGLKSIALRTRDAHRLYRTFGFEQSRADPMSMVLTRA
jgi:GNAT superfamily N-acetyltransferase/nitroimidazol reductase NimA-like FMN-containing flavoprotein (pyridoxamine 5'-phosphate oxidase superfamily)